jgi:hypothetical protein
METQFRDIDLKNRLDLFKRCISNARQGKGSILCVTGEIGFGKTHTLNTFAIECTTKGSGITGVYIESQAPIGKFNIGNIQPLLPFTRAIEYLIEGKNLSAEKKFAKNMVMTALASMPVVGDAFYFVKETAKDWRRFKKEKSSDKVRKVSTATADFYDTLCAYADKEPMVLLMDDMHWCDAQSVELLNLFAENIDTIPLVIVLSIRKDILQSHAFPMLSFMDKHINKTDNVQEVELGIFSREQLSSIVKYFMPNYHSNKEFEDWLFAHSYGVPGVVVEYIRYFLENNPFNVDGSLKVDFSKADFLPSTVQSAFSQILTKLNEEERNILATCSSEGREFSALIISDLMNTDVLSAIKKFRHLQDKTGIIKSMGAHVRYGVKTTLYQFTQAFYHSFFEKSLEYEEHIALHGQIAALLKKKYEEAEEDDIREQIAPYLAAHSSESGDEETTKSMLLFTAQAAQKYGSAEIIREAYDDYVNVGKIERNFEHDNNDINPEQIAFQEMMRATTGYQQQEQNGSVPTENNETFMPEVNYVDFATVRKAIVKDYHLEKYSEAANLALSYLEGHDSEISNPEKAQLLALSAKSYIEIQNFKEAENTLTKALALIETFSDDVSECFVLNTCALLYLSQSKHKDAYDYLEKAAKKAMNLAPELRLLTISNIAKVLKELSPENAGKYINAAHKLSSELNFEEFASEALY